MHLCEITLPTLAENLALDEALLLHAEAGGPEVLRLWEWPRPAAVLGAAGALANEIDEDACRADGVPIARRSSGGGTVLLGPGCLLFSLILRFDCATPLADLHASYRFILGEIQRGLATISEPDALARRFAPSLASASGSEEKIMALQGTSDLALNDRKFSGNAQQRKRTHLLHHGTLLYAFATEPLARYLKPPPRQPAYRAGRSHADFVTNLPTDGVTLREMMKQIWQATDPLTDWPRDLTATLTTDKYATDAWLRRR